MYVNRSILVGKLHDEPDFTGPVACVLQVEYEGVVVNVAIEDELLVATAMPHLRRGCVVAVEGKLLPASYAGFEESDQKALVLNVDGSRGSDMRVVQDHLGNAIKSPVPANEKFHERLPVRSEHGEAAQVRETPPARPPVAPAAQVPAREQPAPQTTVAQPARPAAAAQPVAPPAQPPERPATPPAHANGQASPPQRPVVPGRSNPPTTPGRPMVPPTPGRSSTPPASAGSTPAPSTPRAPPQFPASRPYVAQPTQPARPAPAADAVEDDEIPF